MAKIGIFWVYKGVVIGKAVELEAGCERVPGVVDSDEAHVDVWEENGAWRNRFPELADLEYQDVPRGRVLFLRQQSRALVYADSSLLNAAGRLLIACYFEFDAGLAVWKGDLHYTTSKNGIDKLFDK